MNSFRVAVCARASVLRGNGLSLNFKNRHFFKQSFENWGHIIHPWKLEVATKTTAALAERGHSKTKTQLLSLLGLSNVYRCFVLNFVRTAALLKQLLEKVESRANPALNQDQAEAFFLLKAASSSHLVLRLPRPDLPTFATTRYGAL